MKGSSLFAIAALAAIAGCGSSTSTAISPSTTRCAIALTGASTVAAGGGTGSLSISTARECTWTATSDAPWLTITSTRSGQGEGSIQFSASSNPAPAVRRGTIVVGEARAEVMQAAAPCQFTVAPASLTVDAAGGDRAISIDTLEGCQWTASSSVSWISITATRNTNGPGSLTVHVDANSGGEPRTASFVAAGQSIQVSQSSASSPCSYGLDPPSATVEAEGSNVRFNVAARTGCGWTAVSQSPWIQVVGDGVGAGNGAVSLTVAPNTGTSRIGIVALQDQAFTVVQAASPSPCSYDLAPSSVNIGTGGGPSTVTITTPAQCTWTAASQASWITVTAGSTGIGNGRVELAIAANTGASRSGTVTIAARTFTVNQAGVPAPCTYTIAPTSVSAPRDGGPTFVDVTTQSGCAWTAASNAAWITVAGGASGSGNGRVDLTIAANPDGPRTGTVTIAGQPFTVQQAARPCTYTIAPTSFSAPVAGGAVEVAVTTDATCAWTAVSQAPWIAIRSGATGTGSGRVVIDVAANAAAARSGTVDIAGQLFTVTQGAMCSYTLTPPSLTIPAAGATATVDVASTSTCGWTAVSQVPWITVTRNASGTGDGRIELVIAANAGPARSGTVTIAGQAYVVNQEGIIDLQSDLLHLTMHHDARDP